ncbi:hypothetical protein CAP51_15850 [Acinetobacter populi]|uniref:Uncharacterized protein n=1 Tax=Acinetobacter populi TaxID=1582270 RepID=A0A1Z9YU34_9GAMM|nr:hypothetical protein CAP51_15850 [Acinetobacter populi]
MGIGFYYDIKYDDWRGKITLLINIKYLSNLLMFFRKSNCFCSHDLKWFFKSASEPLKKLPFKTLFLM